MTLSKSAKRAIDDTYKVAAQFKDRFIRSEHLLLGLMLDTTTAASKALLKAGLTYESALAAYMSLRERS